MNQPWVYMCSPSWTPLLPPSPSHPSGSSQCTSPEHHVSRIEPGLAICFTYNNTQVSMLFFQIIPPSPPTESKRLFYTSVSLLLSCIEGSHYHLSKFHIYIFPKKTYRWLATTWKMLNIAYSQRSANQNHNEEPFHAVRTAAIQKSTGNKCWRGCGEKGTLLHCWWECKLVISFFKKPNTIL